MFYPCPERTDEIAFFYSIHITVNRYLINYVYNTRSRWIVQNCEQFFFFTYFMTHYTIILYIDYKNIVTQQQFHSAT